MDRVFRFRTCSSGPTEPALHVAMVTEVAKHGTYLRRCGPPGLIAAHDAARGNAVPFATIHPLGRDGAHVIITTKRTSDGMLCTSMGGVTQRDTARLIGVLSKHVSACWTCGSTASTVCCGMCGVGAACPSCMPSHQASLVCSLVRVNTGSPLLPIPVPPAMRPLLL